MKKKEDGSLVVEKDSKTNVVSIKTASKRKQTIKIKNANVPIKAMGTIDPSSSIDLDNIITDFKKIKYSDFGYDSDSHFLEFLQIDRGSKWNFLFKQLFPDRKNQETLYNKNMHKKKTKKWRKRKTNKENMKVYNKANKTYKQYLNVTPAFQPMKIKPKPSSLRRSLNPPSMDKSSRMSSMCDESDRICSVSDDVRTELALTRPKSLYEKLKNERIDLIKLNHAHLREKLKFDELKTDAEKMEETLNQGINFVKNIAASHQRD